MISFCFTVCDRLIYSHVAADMIAGFKYVHISLLILILCDLTIQ